MALAVAAWLPGGCWQVPEPVPEAIGHYLSSRRDVLRCRRVVLVELAAEHGCPPEVAEDTTEALWNAIQSKRLFHVDRVRQSDPACRDLPLASPEALTLKQLAEIREALRCDAVLFGRAGHFQPYPRMRLGLYLKLLNLKDGKLVWGVDHVWDSTERNTEYRIRRYFYQEMRSGYDPVGYELVLKSPRAFERFVAYEAAETLPPRDLPPQPPAAAPGRARQSASPASRPAASASRFRNAENP